MCLSVQGEGETQKKTPVGPLDGLDLRDDRFAGRPGRVTVFIYRVIASNARPDLEIYSLYEPKLDIWIVIAV